MKKSAARFELLEFVIASKIIIITEKQQIILSLIKQTNIQRNGQTSGITIAVIIHSIFLHLTCLFDVPNFIGPYRATDLNRLLRSATSCYQNCKMITNPGFL